MDTQARIAASGKSDEQLAAETGLSYVTIWRYRKGKSRPGEEAVMPLARALGCTAADLRPDLAALFGNAP